MFPGHRGHWLFSSWSAGSTCVSGHCRQWSLSDSPLSTLARCRVRPHDSCQANTASCPTDGLCCQSYQRGPQPRPLRFFTDPEPPGRRESELLSKQQFPRSCLGSLNINTVHCQVHRGCVCSLWVSTVPLTANQRTSQALSPLPSSPLHPCSHNYQPNPCRSQPRAWGSTGNSGTM